MLGIKVEYRRCRSSKVNKNGTQADKQGYMCKKEYTKTFLNVRFD